MKWKRTRGNKGAWPKSVALRKSASIMNYFCIHLRIKENKVVFIAANENEKRRIGLHNPQRHEFHTEACEISQNCLRRKKLLLQILPSFISSSSSQSISAFLFLLQPQYQECIWLLFKLQNSLPNQMFYQHLFFNVANIRSISNHSKRECRMI